MSTTTAPLRMHLTSGGGPTIFVRDVEKSVAFYRDVLSMRVLFQAGPHFAMMDAGDGLQIGLHPEAKNAGAPGTRGSIQVCLTCAQPIEDVVSELQSRGVKFDERISGKPIIDDDPVRLAFFTDPDGNDLYLYEMKRA